MIFEKMSNMYVNNSFQLIINNEEANLLVNALYDLYLNEKYPEKYRYSSYLLQAKIFPLL